MRVILRKIPSFQSNKNEVADPEKKEGFRIPTTERKIDHPIHEEPNNFKENDKNKVKMVNLKPPTDKENPKMKQKRAMKSSKPAKKSNNKETSNVVKITDVFKKIQTQPKLVGQDIAILESQQKKITQPSTQEHSVNEQNKGLICANTLIDSESSQSGDDTCKSPDLAENNLIPNRPYFFSKSTDNLQYDLCLKRGYINQNT